MNSLFDSIFTAGTAASETSSATSVDVGNFLLIVCVSLLVGAFLAAVYSFRTRTSASFLLTIGILPAIVCVVILMVNGNIGAGVAVAGAFSLVRFRSVPGKGREIAVLFLSMGVGLILGMGYIGYAVLFSAIIGIVIFLFNEHEAKSGASNLRLLRITVPEDLDFSGEFDETLCRYSSDFRLRSMKTTNMGTLYKLTYQIAVKDPKEERALIDELRTKNGNLEVVLSDFEEDGNML